MSILTSLLGSTINNIKPLTSIVSSDIACVRYASKKASGSTRIKPGHPRPKHRGWKVQDGHYVNAGAILVTQLKSRFHPGLNVGLGCNGTLYAIESGKVMVTCEKINPDPGNPWIIKNYSKRLNQDIYKKHFNVIPEPQHDRFVVIDKV